MSGVQHSHCFHCNTSLTGKKYVLRQDQPICVPCFDEKFADRCESCQNPIGTDSKDLSYKGRHWHDKCFKCWACQDLLANQQFVGKDDGLYCTDCYDNNFAERCDLCNKTFKHGMQKFEYNGKKYHNSCFLCSICNKPLGNNSFIPRDQNELICLPCYNENYAQKCMKCGEVLSSGGVTFRDAAYHKECFCCTKCNTPLAEQKFATNDQDPYCSDCYVQVFAKMCEFCSKPISGIGKATRYVSLKTKQWHVDCFRCNECKKSVADQGFVVVNENVMCSDCGANM